MFPGFPRPSQHPIFDHLQYAKTEGERWSIFNDVGVYLGRQRGGRVPHRRDELEAFSCSFFQNAQVLNVHKVKNVPLVVQNKGTSEMCSFDQGPLSHSVYLGRHWCHSFDNMDQAFPLRLNKARLFSLTATRVSTLWLKQPICLCRDIHRHKRKN